MSVVPVLQQNFLHAKRNGRKMNKPKANPESPYKSVSLPKDPAKVWRCTKCRKAKKVSDFYLFDTKSKICKICRGKLEDEEPF